MCYHLSIVLSHTAFDPAILPIRLWPLSTLLFSAVLFLYIRVYSGVLLKTEVGIR